MRRLRAAVVWAACLAGLAIGARDASAMPVAQDPTTTTVELLFDQGKRQFDAFQYDQAVPLFDRLIQAMTTGPEVQNRDLLVQVYELRARARFALGDSVRAEQDFASLLALKPEFALDSGVSPKVINVFENVRKLTIGQLSVQITPPGDISISGRVYTATDQALVIDLTGGEHIVTAARTNFTPFEEKITVTPGTVTALTILLERVSATVAVVTTPEDVEVLLDDVSKGRTPKGATPGVSAPLSITDVPLGSHRLKLTRACYVDREVPVTVGAEDLQTEPIQLTPAVATVTIKTTDREAILVVDGQVHGPILGEVTVCEGSRLIEVRSSRGRFIDRRVWKAGDAVTLTADLKSALPIVMAKAGPGSTPEQLRAAVERAMAPAKRVLVYAPASSDLDAALKQENIPADWLAVPGTAGDKRLPAEAVRDISRRLATRLAAQGVVAAIAGDDAITVSLLILAAGSAEPDVITLSLADSGSQGRAVERISAAVPRLVQASLDSSFIDVAEVAGAVVVRAGAASGLGAGDVVTAAAGKPVTSVADLRSALASHGAAATIALDVKAPSGPARIVPAPVVAVIDTLPVRDPALLANRSVLDLRELLASAPAGVQKTAAAINLSLVLMRLGNWDDALAALKDVQVAEGAGVSAGTVAYLNGLALDGLGRTADAQAAFTKAAASTQARLWFEGPLVAPLAKSRLQTRR